ncbi:MAG: GH3 auxin-responsive promoter-binding protein, partial [Desulfofundulus sp.]
ATEAMVGIAIRPGETSYVLTPRTAFFEFIPADQLDKSNPATLNLNQLEPGQSYEVVVTNYAGLYRYRLGDIIKVTGYFNNSPVIEFLHRKGQLLNLAGEKTLEEAVYCALGKAARQWGCVLVDYTTALDLDTSPGRYVFFVEVLNPEGLTDMTQCRDVLEKALEEANPRYGANLKAGRIGNLSLRVVKPGTFQELQQRLIAKGASMNQVKVPRLVEDQKLLQFLSRSVINSKCEQGLAQ